MITIINKLQDILDISRAVDFLGPLALRLYLVPVFWVAGTNKIGGMENTIAWFGNPDWGLGLPFPALMAWLAVLAEVVGASLLLIGLATRWATIPLMVTMLVAIFAVHIDNGWQAIHDPMSPFASPHVDEAVQKLNKAKDLLKDHGNYSWLTEYGSFVKLNNGIEFGATYFVMLLALFFTGGGKYLSADYWIARAFRKS